MFCLLFLWWHLYILLDWSRRRYPTFAVFSWRWRWNFSNFFLIDQLGISTLRLLSFFYFIFIKILFCLIIKFFINNLFSKFSSLIVIYLLILRLIGCCFFFVECPNRRLRNDLKICWSFLFFFNILVGINC